MSRVIERVTIATALLLAIVLWTWSSETGYLFDHGNQLVHLVELQRILDPGFLARDWFLNAGGEGVRHAYLGTLAALSWVVGVPAAMLALWILQLGLLAAAGYQLGRALHPARAAAFLAATLCILVPGPALADHWLVRGELNPAPLAKALALLALALWLGGRRGAVPALIGATLIHAQVGALAAGLVAVAWATRAAWRWRHPAPTPPLARSALAGATYAAALVAALWPLLRSGPPLEAEFLQLVVARFRFPWHFVPSCLDPAEVALFVSLGLAGLLSLRLAGLRRGQWAVAAILGALVLAAVALAWLGRVGEAWQGVWPALTLAAALTALGETIAVLRARRGLGEGAWTERGTVVTAVSAALVVGLAAGVLFVEVVPLGLAIELRLLRLSVIAKALALVVIAGPLARAMLRGPLPEAIVAAVSTVALLAGQPLPAVVGLAVLDFAPAVSPRRAGLLALVGAGLAALALGLGEGLDGRRLTVGALVLAAAWAGRRGWLDVGAHDRERRLALAGLALGAAAATVVVLAPGLAGRTALPPPSDLDRLAAWARGHTERDAVFLVPLDALGWRRFAERAIVVDLGAVPFGRTAMREWLQRIAAVVGYPGRDPRSFLTKLAAPACAWPIGPLSRGYAAQGPAELGRLAGRYGARYAVREEDSAPLPWAILHREGRFTLYAVPDG
jgi:hypothetical protein